MAVDRAVDLAPEPGRTQPNLAGLFYVGRFSEVCFVIRARWQALIGLSSEWMATINPSNIKGPNQFLTSIKMTLDST